MPMRCAVRERDPGTCHHETHRGAQPERTTYHYTHYSRGLFVHCRNSQLDLSFVSSVLCRVRYLQLQQHGTVSSTAFASAVRLLSPTTSPVSASPLMARGHGHAHTCLHTSSAGLCADGGREDITADRCSVLGYVRLRCHLGSNRRHAIHRQL